MSWMRGKETYLCSLYTICQHVNSKLRRQHTREVEINKTGWIVMETRLAAHEAIGWDIEVCLPHYRTTPTKTINTEPSTHPLNKSIKLACNYARCMMRMRERARALSRVLCSCTNSI